MIRIQHIDGIPIAGQYNVLNDWWCIIVFFLLSIFQREYHSRDVSSEQFSGIGLIRCLQRIPMEFDVFDVLSWSYNEQKFTHKVPSPF